jgi:hypothetical protein
MYRNRGVDNISKSFLRLQYHEKDNTWELYNIHYKGLHTHSRHKRVLVKIKKDIEHHRLPATRDLNTLNSYTRVTTNKRYLRQLERIIKEVKDEVQEETSGS